MSTGPIAKKKNGNLDSCFLKAVRKVGLEQRLASSLFHSKVLKSRYFLMGP